MKACSSCGFKNYDDPQICRGCGQHLDSEVDGETTVLVEKGFSFFALFSSFFIGLIPAFLMINSRSIFKAIILICIYFIGGLFFGLLTKRYTISGVSLGIGPLLLLVLLIGVGALGSSFILVIGCLPIIFSIAGGRVAQAIKSAGKGPQRTT